MRTNKRTRPIWLLALLVVVAASCKDGSSGANDAAAGSESAQDAGGAAEGERETFPDHTVGILLNDAAAWEGYTLFAPLGSTTTWLVDMTGRVVHSWQSAYRPGNSVYLLEGGELLHTGSLPSRGSIPYAQQGGAGGMVEKIAADGSQSWSFEYASEAHWQHHDVALLPNGNILMIAWEHKTEAEAIAAGRDPATIDRGMLWPDHLIEVRPEGSSGGTIVWEWHVWDHLVQDFDATRANYGVVADHPERIDLNFVARGPDWNHVNSVAYHQELDQIVLSVHAFGEIWVIDHSTTTAEAAGSSGGRYGRGGDLLYRWGNPQAYDHGGPEDQQLSGQHDAHWIPAGLPGAGNLLIFNNGTGRGYSSVDEIEPPLGAGGDYVRSPGVAFGPDSPAWSYTADPPEDLYSGFISGAQRLPGGNTLICSGADGTFLEVTAAGELVWKYINPVTGAGVLSQGDPLPQGGAGESNSVFRATRVSTDDPGLAGLSLVPGEPLEGE